MWSPNYDLVTLQLGLSYMASGTSGWKCQFVGLGVGFPAMFSLPSVDMAGARDGSWGCLHFALHYLAAKPSHEGADVDGIAYHLHYPRECG
jgi:hypothetical protein